MNCYRFAVALTVVLASAASLAGSVQAQATTGTIRGQVVSDEGLPLPNAAVVVTNQETGLQRSGTTDRMGRYQVPLLPPGPYDVAVTLIGHRPTEVQAVRVTVGETQTVSVELETVAVEVEEIRVLGERARIDVAQGGVQQTIEAEQVENLPTLGRDFTDFLNLSPLVSPQPEVTTGGQFSIAGARSSGTNIRIDGVDANNVFFGENRGSSRTPFPFSLESIREFQLVTNGFDVEHGNYQGGVVNVVTRGGTNELRGSAHLFFRDEGLTRSDFLGVEASEFQVFQFGGNVSGPVVEDRLHFYLSVDAQLKDQPIFAGDPIGTPVAADSLARMTSILSGVHGLENPDRFFGRFTQDEDNLVLFGRLDWTIDDNHRLTFRANYSDFEQTNDRIGINAITHGGPFQDQVVSTVAELNSQFGPDVFNQLRVQFSYEDRPRPFQEDGGFLPEIRVRGLNDAGLELRFGGDGIVFRNRLEETKFELINNFSYQAGDHTFKLGTSNILFNTQNTFWLLGNGSYTFNSLEDFGNNDPATYFRLTRACPVALQPNSAGEPVICPEPDVPFADFTALEWNFYLQDSWQATDRLLLVGGLRFGGTTFTDDPSPVPAVEQAFGIETGVVPSFTGLSPRFSFTYDLLGDQSRLVRGGVGLLTGRAPSVLAGNVFQTERPLLSIFCAGEDVPNFDLQEFLADPTGLNNPLACAGGEAPTGRPEHAVFDPDYTLPKTLAANLGYEHLLGTGTKLGVDLLFRETRDMFRVTDRNLREPAFFLEEEGGRPVFVPQPDFGPTSGAGPARLQDPAFDRIFVNVSDARARAVAATFEVDQRILDHLMVGARYAHTRSFDNSSFSCCTSGEGFTGEPTAGDPNFVGDFGDDQRGAWGPTRFERRHVIATNFLWRAPANIRLNGIWRLQSGTPFTPVVRGDINADGASGNDRAFVGTNLQFATPEDAAAMATLLEEHSCLADQVGRIAARNSCRNPWFNSVNLRASWEIPTTGRQRAELILDAFNVLNLINSDWGQFMGSFGSNTELLQAQGFDETTGNVIYSVNRRVDAETGEVLGFGTTLPAGFDPFQGQLQLGIRYKF